MIETKGNPMGKMTSYTPPSTTTSTYPSPKGNGGTNKPHASSLMTSALEPSTPQSRKQDVTLNFRDNTLSQFVQYQNPGEAYEAYVQSLGKTIDKLDIQNGTTIEIETVTGDLIQVQTIKFQEFAGILESQKSQNGNNKQKLPIKQDYIDKYNAKLQKQAESIPGNNIMPASTSLNQDPSKENNGGPACGTPLAQEYSFNSSKDEEEINPLLTQSQILSSSIGASIIGKLKTLKKSNLSQSDPNLSPPPLSQSLLASFVAPEGINLVNSQLLEDSSGQGKEIQKNCKAILQNMQQPTEYWNQCVKKILGNQNFSDPSSATILSSESTAEIDNKSYPDLLQTEQTLFKEVLTQYVINHFADELILTDTESEYYKAYQDLKLLSDSINITAKGNTDSIQVLTKSLPQKLIAFHPKVAIMLFALCFPGANIIECWNKISPEKSILTLWEELNTKKSQDFTLKEFFQEYFPGYLINEENKDDKVNKFLPKQETSAIEESSEEESEEQEEPSEEESEFFQDPEDAAQNEKILERLLTIIDNPQLTKRINQSDNTSKESDNGATPTKSALSAAEATSFVQFLCLVHIHNQDVPTPQNWEQILQTVNPINDENLKKITNDENGIQEFSKTILLHNPNEVIEIFSAVFPNVNITESWHLLFPNFSIEQLKQEEAFKDLTFEEFLNQISISFTPQQPDSAEVNPYSSDDDSGSSTEQEKISYPEVENNIILYYTALNPKEEIDIVNIKPKEQDISINQSTDDFGSSKEEEKEVVKEEVEGKNNTDTPPPTSYVLTVVTNPQAVANPLHHEVPSTSEQPASKGFFATFFDSISGFTSSIFSSLGSIFRSKNSTMQDPKITKNASGSEEHDTSTDDLTPTSPSESKSFGGIIDSIFSMFHAIGSWFGESQAIALHTDNNDAQVLGKTPGETTNDLTGE